jgi:imidazolonepropionase-like amidohydrolase
MRTTRHPERPFRFHPERSEGSPILAAATRGLLATLAFAATLGAQSSPGEGGTWVIRGGTVITGTGERLSNTSLLIRDGRIEQMGSGISASGAKVVDASGKFVYPGMIDTWTPIGLVEIGGIQPMTLRSEIGDYNPHMRAIVALNLDSEFLGVTRMNGVTSVITSPSGGVISGQAALINTAGWTWEDLTVKAPAAIVMTIPGGGGGGGRGGGGGGGGRGAGAPAPTAANPTVEFHNFMRAAQEYHTGRTAGATRVNLVYEPMRALFRREIPAIVTASSEAQIRQAVELGDTYNIRVVIQGGGQAWRVRQLLAQKNVPVLLSSIQSAPAATQPYDEIYAQPGVLHEAGVKFAFSTGSGASARHVPFHASLAVAYGLPADVALKALTIWPAEIFGAEKDIGSIARGKMANFMITTGDPLDLRTQITDVFIKGRRTPPDDRHSRLWLKYKARPLPGRGGG